MILDANPAFLNVVGYQLDEIRGQQHSMFCAPQLVASAEYKRFWQRLADGESFSDRFMRQGQGGARSGWRPAISPFATPPAGWIACSSWPPTSPARCRPNSSMKACRTPSTGPWL
ncbi:PAS domain-containing protein [Halopseudomonas maritima]|uniref:PAS domain-containing protein n=1 Tax=Halopseudomonas maritima TaxID=2918528 RepID=UPI001EEB2A80